MLRVLRVLRVLLMRLLRISHERCQKRSLLGHWRQWLGSSYGTGDGHGTGILLGHSVVALKVLEIGCVLLSGLLLLVLLVLLMLLVLLLHLLLLLLSVGSGVNVGFIAAVVAVAFLGHDAGPVGSQGFQVFLLSRFRFLLVHLSRSSLNINCCNHSTGFTSFNLHFLIRRPKRPTWKPRFWKPRQRRRWGFGL